jgi:hypothetical protein
MSWQFLDPAHMRKWLLGDLPKRSYLECQDAPWVLASEFRADTLLDLIATPHALSDRRDDMLFLIGLRLEWLLDPNEPDPDNVPEEGHRREVEQLADFVVAHPRDFIDRKTELGFGGDYDTFVIPFIKSRLERPDAGT